MASTKPHLYKRPDNGQWYLDYGSEGAGRRRISLRTSDRSVAEQRLDQFVAGLNNPAPPKQVLVSAILKGYLEDRLKTVSSKLTLANSCRQVEKVIGNLAPEHMSQATADKYAATRRAQGIADGTIIRELVTVRAAMRWAIRQRWFSDEPKFKMPVEQPPPRDRALTREECQALLSACDTPHLKLFVKLMLGTGARPGAIMGLTWDRVDLDMGLIDLGADVGNKRKATVPINAMVRQALSEAWDVSTCANVIEFAGKPIKSIKTAFRKALVRAGLKDVVPHTLRHTAATTMAMSGVPLSEIALMLGDSEKIVEKVYRKYTPGYLQRASDALNF